jgi:hypothetical protein
VTAIASRFFYYFLLLLFSLWFEKRQKIKKYVTAVAIVVVLEAVLELMIVIHVSMIVVQWIV